MLTVVRPLQEANAVTPIVVTELGMVTEVKYTQDSKALGTMAVTE